MMNISFLKTSFLLCSFLSHYCKDAIATGGLWIERLGEPFLHVSIFAVFSDKYSAKVSALSAWYFFRTIWTRAGDYQILLFL